jgi:hypothetical protein
MLRESYSHVTAAHLIFAKVTWLFICTITLCFATNGQTALPTPTAGEQKKAEQPAREKIKRWFELDALTISTRYRFIRTRNGVTTNNQQQYQLNARAHFKFDPKGRYSVYTGLFTGNNITGGWNNTGIGTGDGQTNLYLKQLYFSAKPVKEIEVQFGGIGVTNGENTEIIGYDNDVYLTGERVVVRQPKHLYFDEIGVTYAYIGDFTRPSVFKRFKHLDKSNYHQFLVRKQVNKRVSFSADYTFESGRDTLHEAVKIKFPKSLVLDSVLFENYQRIDPDPGYGFNIVGEKVIRKKLTLNGGFAHIDRTFLNGDRFPRGNRLHFSAAYKFNPEFSISSVIIQGVGPLATPQTHRRRFDLIFSYNILETLRRLKIQ